jgi:transposase
MPTKEELHKLFVEGGLSLGDTATAIGYSRRQTSRFLKQFGISLPPNERRWGPRTLSREQLSSMYVDQGMSAGDIAKESGKSTPTILRWLRQDGVETRARNEAAAMPARRERIAVSKYKGGSVDGKGYRSMHRNRADNGKQRTGLHRLIAEAILARPLTAAEVVHHVNGCGLDNRPANLWVFPTQADHNRYHRTGTIHPDTIKLIPYCGELSSCQLAT